MSLDVYLKDPTATYETDYLYEANITHNLNKMADEALIYQALWRPEEISCVQAKDIIGKLALGLDILNREPERFKKLNPENGWGNYEGFVSFVEKYLNACEKYPEAIIEISR